MVSRMMGSKRVSRRTMFAAERACDPTVLYMPVLDMLGQVIVHLGHTTTLTARKLVLVYLNYLRFDELINFLEKLFS